MKAATVLTIATDSILSIAESHTLIECFLKKDILKNVECLPCFYTNQYESSTTRRPLPAGGGAYEGFLHEEKKEKKKKKG